MVEVSFCIRTLPDRLRNGARSYCYIVEGRMNVEKYPLQCFFCQNPFLGVLDNFFPTGTYTGIGTSASSLKHVMKSTTKKKYIICWIVHYIYANP